MKNYLITAIVFSALIACEPPKTESVATETSAEISDYDSLLAQKVGADEYGMRKYVFANLIAGPNRSQEPEEAARLQRAHLDNIQRMAQEGKLVLAGPFMDSGEVRGIYVFAVETIEEAEALTNTDPAIQAGRLKMELRPWYGSAALMKLTEIHSKVSKTKI